MLAEEGNRDAILQIAEMYENRASYPMALYWYRQIASKTIAIKDKIKELASLINENQSYEEDIF